MRNNTPDITDQFLNILCRKIEIAKYAVDGPYRSVDSYGMTFSKSLRTICEKGYVSHDCLNEALLETVKQFNDDNLQVTHNGFDVKSYMVGLVTIPIVIGGYTLVKHTCNEYKENKENKEKEGEQNHE